MASSKKICDICLRFPWHNLPAEDAGGQQHHATRRQLEEAAKACPTCRLVLRAAVANYRDSRGIRNGKGYWRQHNCILYKDASGTHQMNVVKELGVCLPAGQITPSNSRSRTIVSCVPVQEVGAMAPGYRTGQTILMPTGPVDANFNVGDLTSEQEQSNDHLESDTLDSPVWVYGNWWCHRDIRKAGLHPHLVGVGARFGRTASPWDAVNTSPGKVHLRGSNIRLFTNDGSSFEHIPGRMIEKDSSSPMAFKRLKLWVDDCVAGHPVCARQPGIPKLPSRVLDLDAARSFVRLIETNDGRAEYATLSHTWSRSSCMTTTTDNLLEHKRGIVLMDLPPTFRDAVTVTRQLGIRYLWIDCLCIVQDDPSDRENEMASMGRIYRNSHLTISAAFGKDSYEGCFPLQRQTSQASPASRSLGYDKPPGSESYSIGFLTGQGAPSFVHLSEDWLPGSSGALPQFSNGGAFGQHWDPISEEHLSTRGWALQERLLSRRIIHYTKSQMFFECQCGLQSEDGFHIPNQRFSLQQLVHSQQMSLADRKAAESSRPSFVRGGPSKKQDVRDSWRLLIEDYTARQLTDPEERLTAIAGAARVLAEHTQDQYLAGLWRSRLFEDLCWRRKPSSGKSDVAVMDVSHKDRVTSPQEYRAPSWSWAALDTPVDFLISEQESLAQVARCHMSAAGLDPYGGVSDGELEILAPLFELCATNWSTRGDDGSVQVHINKTADDGHTQKFAGSFFSDAPSHGTSSPSYALFLNPLHALVIQTRDRSGKQPQVPTSELVRDRTETELPNWGWKHEDDMVRVGIAEFSPEAADDVGAEQLEGWADDVVSALSLDDQDQDQQLSGPASKDDIRICVVIK